MKVSLMFLIVGFSPLLANWLYRRMNLLSLTTVNRILDTLMFFCFIGIIYILLFRP